MAVVPNEASATSILIAENKWERLNPNDRKRLVWILWFMTWIGLLLGYFNERAWYWVVLFSAAHAVLFWSFFGYLVDPFPVQVRIAYFLWVLIGTFAPFMMFLMYITTVGLAANLIIGYCPLARMMSLLSWNRGEALSWSLVKRTFLSPPSEGRFTPPELLKTASQVS